jgi:hypothetical protein
LHWQDSWSAPLPRHLASDHNRIKTNPVCLHVQASLALKNRFFYMRQIRNHRRVKALSKVVACCRLLGSSPLERSYGISESGVVRKWSRVEQTSVSLGT